MYSTLCQPVSNFLICPFFIHVVFAQVLVLCELELIRVIINQNVQLKGGFMLNCDKFNSMLNSHCNISVASRIYFYDCMYCVHGHMFKIRRLDKILQQMLLCRGFIWTSLTKRLPLIQFSFGRYGNIWRNSCLRTVV